MLDKHATKPNNPDEYFSKTSSVRLKFQKKMGLVSNVTGAMLGPSGSLHGGECPAEVCVVCGLVRVQLELQFASDPLIYISCGSSHWSRSQKNWGIYFQVLAN